MLSTTLLAVSFVGLLLTSVTLWAFFLRLGLRWTKTPEVTTRRVLFTAAIAQSLQFALSMLFLIASHSTDVQASALALVEMVAAVLVGCVVIGVVFKTRFLRSLQAWFPTMAASLLTVVLALLVFRPFVFEAFTTPLNSMAPTLLGTHWRATCPVCGAPRYCTPMEARFASIPPTMICDNFHVSQTQRVDDTVSSGDRFLVAKFLAPRRWDLVVFRYPNESSTYYVKRLVGFPGEEVRIQEGAVWVNSKRQTPPAAIQGIEYLSEMANWRGPALWGSEGRAAVLGDDEYFVLGDFSAQSNDSRLWDQGAAGHNAFAVPQSHLEGVVTHTYWPPSRWRVHR